LYFRIPTAAGTAAAAALYGLVEQALACSPSSATQAGPDKWLAAAPASHFFCLLGFLRTFYEYRANIHESAPLCWNCHERTLGTHFCRLRKLRQIPQSLDYFALFEMPKKLWIEMEGLERKFLQLSWKLHPDNFVNATELEAIFRSSAAPN